MLEQLLREVTEWASQLIGKARQQGLQNIVITYSTMSAHAARLSGHRGPCGSLADAAAGPPAQPAHLLSLIVGPADNFPGHIVGLAALW